MDFKSIVESAQAATALTMAGLVSRAADSVHSHQMYLQAVNAEIRIRNNSDSTPELVAQIQDFLVLLAHEALLADTTSGAERAVRLLDLRLELEHELTAWSHFKYATSKLTAPVLVAAALRCGMNPASLKIEDVSMESVKLVDPLVLQKVFPDPQVHERMLAILRANPGIEVLELLSATRATALPADHTSSRFDA